MALVKHNNNSISSITTPGQIAQGKMTLISSQTASGSASISFTSGIDSTYPIYKFELIELHPASRTQLTFNFSSDSGSNYNVTKTTTLFYAIHTEDNITAGLSYDNTKDLAQGTGFQILTRSDIDEDNDSSCSGEIFLFNPSSTTFVKHFISRMQQMAYNNASADTYVAGYGNTTSAIDGVQFKMASGNIDAGTIKLYGIGD
jgi:hypothetical protein